MTEKALAEKLKLTRQTLRYYRQIGCPFTINNGHLSYEFETVLEWRKHALVPRSKGRGLPEFERARAMRMHFSAKKSELDFLQRKGQLVDREACEAAAARCSAHIRSTLMQLADRLAPAIAAEPDPVKIHAVLTREYRRLLESLGAALLPASPTE